MILNYALTITTEPQILVVPETVDSLRGHTFLLKVNEESSKKIYLGDENVTAENGYPKAGGSEVAFKLETIQGIYAVAEEDVEVRLLVIDYK